MKDLGKNRKKPYRLRNQRHIGLRARLLPFFLGAGLLLLTSAISSGNFPILNAIATPSFASSSCNIKGNVSYNQGRKIFHVPGQKDYYRTKISSRRGERWFCSEAEARAAGWRKARR